MSESRCQRPTNCATTAGERQGGSALSGRGYVACTPIRLKVTKASSVPPSELSPIAKQAPRTPPSARMKFDPFALEFSAPASLCIRPRHRGGCFRPRTTEILQSITLRVQRSEGFLFCISGAARGVALPQRVAGGKAIAALTRGQYETLSVAAAPRKRGRLLP
jgi:hypothetical protein